MLELADRSIVEVARELALHGVEASYLVPTSTGLDKAIMDAIAPLRDYLKHAGIHDFDLQSQGEAHKHIVPGAFVEAREIRATSVSLYRPTTKQGDPRIWVYGLKEYASAGNVLALLAVDGTLQVVNASRPGIWESRQHSGTPLNNLLQRLSPSLGEAAIELLARLKGIGAKGFIKSVRAGDTGVGATLEAELGIATNSRRTPDFRGIEIKASRRVTARARNRVSLFSQIPNWELSRYKDGAEIVKSHGYVRDGRTQLYCTVSAEPNSQGLYLAVEDARDMLANLHSSGNVNEPVCVWLMADLRARLGEKHAETFWVKAKVAGSRSAGESFHFTEVEHTSAPLVANLAPMFREGTVTFDYTLSLKPSGRARDHGYLFKIHPEDFGLLFPPSRIHSLID